MVTRKVVRVRLTEDMLGTVPKDKEVYASYIETKKPETQTEDETETVDDAMELEEKGWTGFHSDETGLFIYDYMVKGFVRYAGNVLRESIQNPSTSTKKKPAYGITALKQRLTDFFFVYPRRIHLGKTEPDGSIERPLRSMTTKGPRTSLARSDTIAAGTEFEFEYELLKCKTLTHETIAEILAYGERQGLGQWRNAGYGRFEVISITDVA